MKINKLIVLMIIGLFLMSVVPAVLADSDDTDRSDSTERSDSDDAMHIDDTDTRERTKLQERLRTRIKTEAGEIRKEVEHRIETKDGVTKERLEERFETIRTHQREQLQIAVAKCREVAENPAECEAKLEKRMDLVNKLEAKDLERIESIQERRAEHRKEFAELQKKEHYAKFKHEAKARELRVEHRLEARERFDKAKEDFAEAREQFRAEREAFAKLRQTVAACGDEESEECDAARADVKLSAQGMIQHSLDMMLEHAHKLRAVVEESEHLTDEEATETLADIDERIAELESLQADAEAITEDTPKEDIQKLAQDVAAQWENHVKPSIERHAGFVMASRMGGTIVRSEQIVNKLDRVMEQAAEKGIDTSMVESQVEEFNALVADAQALHEDAAEQYEAASTLTGKERAGAIKEARTTLKAAQEKLREAHSVLVNIHKELRANNLVEELEDDDTDDAVEEAEDESDEEDEEEGESDEAEDDE